MQAFKGTVIALAASMLLAHAAPAQTNPTADDLVKSLTPSASALKSSGTRGLRRLSAEPTGTPVTSASAGTTMPGRRATTAPAATSEAPSATLYVQFATGSAELTPRAMATLDELGKALTSNALSSYHFRIEGYTDTVGTKTANQELSERRAEAVVAYIKEKFGVDPSRMTAVGFGETHLLVPTPAQTPEARNRRVQVVNLGA